MEQMASKYIYELSGQLSKLKELNGFDTNVCIVRTSLAKFDIKLIIVIVLAEKCRLAMVTSTLMIGRTQLL